MEDQRPEKRLLGVFKCDGDKGSGFEVEVEMDQVMEVEANSLGVEQDVKFIPR